MMYTQKFPRLDDIYRGVENRAFLAKIVEMSTDLKQFME